jgi:hypothetical protein
VSGVGSKQDVSITISRRGDTALNAYQFGQVSEALARADTDTVARHGGPGSLLLCTSVAAAATHARVTHHRLCCRSCGRAIVATVCASQWLSALRTGLPPRHSTQPPGAQHLQPATP